MTWAALLEDQFDEATAGLRPDSLATVLDSFRAVLLGEAGLPARPVPAAAALADLWQRTEGGSPPQWHRRFYDHMSDGLRCQLRASVHRATRTPLDVATCVELRGRLGWAAFAHDLQHHIHQVGIPEAVYCSTIYQTLLWSAADVIMWTNDLVSHTREAAVGETSNLALTVQAERGLTSQQAVDHVHRMIADRLQVVLEASLELPGLVRSLRLGDEARLVAEQCLTHLRTRRISACPGLSQPAASPFRNTQPPEQIPDLPQPLLLGHPCVGGREARRSRTTGGGRHCHAWRG
ncbi:terpene synthase family protein [Streptomyces abikoensis]|uniref:terpene synthase family protein n=1 Tax=Streptomyces abikoensis TaxID=97398 RepID=UPI00371D1332